MFFSLPLSNNKDLTINTNDKEPLQIKDWQSNTNMKLTKGETEALLELL